MDVYGYSADDLSRREGVVRVDAGRVRRKLASYYQGAGAADRVVISLPVGSYAPEFLAGSAKGAEPRHRRPLGIIAAGAALVLTGLLVAFFARKSATVRPGNGQTTIYDVAPARV